MIYDPREAARVRAVVLMIAAGSWALLIAGSCGAVAFAHCAEINNGAVSLPTSLSMLLAMNPPLSMLSGWMLMLAAMMLPVLTDPIYHVYLSSFARRRLRSIAFFLAGYAGIWIAAGALLLSIELGVKLLAPQSWLPAFAASVIAIIWQFSPLKQRCLNRCHAHKELAAFGAAADLAALRYGMGNGMWCVSTCWAWMLVPILLPRGHLITMAAITVLIFSERLEQPQSPAWRVRGMGKAARILVAQTHIHRKRVKFSSGVAAASRVTLGTWVAGVERSKRSGGLQD